MYCLNFVNVFVLCKALLKSIRPIFEKANSHSFIKKKDSASIVKYNIPFLSSTFYICEEKQDGYYIYLILFQEQRNIEYLNYTRKLLAQVQKFENYEYNE